MFLDVLVQPAVIVVDGMPVHRAIGVHMREHVTLPGSGRVVVMGMAMGLVFEMPAIIYALVRVHVLNRPWLGKQRRFVFLACFIIGAIITPTPDPFNQTLVSLPLYLLFELGLFLSRFA